MTKSREGYASNEETSSFRLMAIFVFRMRRFAPGAS